MTDEYADHPGGLTEQETLARLTVEEKLRIARPAILDFPHLDQNMLIDWLRGYGCETAVSTTDTEADLTNKLLACLEEKVTSGDEPEGLDHFIYGYTYPAMLRQVDIDPEEVAERDPLEQWDGVYDD